MQFASTAGPKPRYCRSDPPNASASQYRVQPRPTDALQISRSSLLKTSFGWLLASAAAPFPVSADMAVASAESIAASIAASPTTAIQEATSLSQVVLKTLSDCELAVSVYPTFSYSAAGGGGTGHLIERMPDGILKVSFPPETLVIPPVSTATSAIIGIPLPPPLKISISPRKLEGFVDPMTGRVDLNFDAEFQFTAGSLYRASPLQVATTLTTEESSGPLRQGRGQRLDANGRVRMVGVARVPPTGDKFLDTFLMLPTDALAVLSAELVFQP
jgi:hypothetical protein